MKKTKLGITIATYLLLNKLCGLRVIEPQSRNDIHEGPLFGGVLYGVS